MGSAIFSTPQIINYGRKSFENVGKETAKRGAKALIISDHVMMGLGYVSNCKNYLQEDGVGIELYLGVESEPTDKYVQEALEIYEKEKCDIIISLGGGSCIDTAKAVSVVATNGGYIGDYMGGRKLVENSPVQHISIPTTAGTGSEATDATIITNTETDIKMMIKQPPFMPDVAIVDPLLTISSPRSVTAATGIDALSHAIEAYISKKSQPMTDMLALSAMKLIVKNLKTSYENGKDLDAREGVSLGSLQAGMAFSNASVCLVHGMSRPIGALFHVPHGISNAMLLPAVLEYSMEKCTERLADLGRLFQEDMRNISDDQAAEIAVEEVKKLCLDLGIPNLKEYGIDSSKFDLLIDKMAEDALASGSPQNNPKVPTKQEIKELYQICYDYTLSEEKTARS